MAQQLAVASTRKRLLEEYHKRTPSPPPGKRVKIPSLMDLKESISVKTSTQKSGVGEMMWKGHYVRRLPGQAEEWRCHMEPHYLSHRIAKP